MTLKIGELEKVATDDGFIWYAGDEANEQNFGQVPFALLAQMGQTWMMRLLTGRAHRQ